MADDNPTYGEVLAPLTRAEELELLHKKLDWIAVSLNYIHNQLRDEMKWNVLDPKLQAPPYPYPMNIIYPLPSVSGNPPFWADSGYIAEGWPWPDVPPGEASETSELPADAEDS